MITMKMKKITMVCLILLALGLVGQAFLPKREPQAVTFQARSESPATAPVKTADASERQHPLPERQRPLVDLRRKQKIQREEVLFADRGLEGGGEARMSGGDADEREEREGKRSSRKGRYSFVGHVPRFAQQGASNAAKANDDKPKEQRINRGGRSFDGDLRTLPQTKPTKKERPEREGPVSAPRLKEGVTPPTTPSGAGPINVPTAAAPAPAPSFSFDGLDFANWGAGHPPDTVGDVGPTYYIQAINNSIGIFRKSDGVRVAAFTFNTFMSQGAFGNLCDTNNFGDPVILYDTFEDRWVISDFAFQVDGSGNVVNPPGAFQCIAVSKTGDPVAGGWNYYSLNTTDGLNDYPKLGIWPDGIYMSANMFGFGAGGAYQGSRVWALNKAQMYAGAPTIQVVSFNPPASDFTLLPANARLQTGTPPVGTPNYFVATWQFLDALTVYKFKVDWNNISASSFTGPDTPQAATSWPNASVPNAPSLGGNSLDVAQIRAMMQNQYTNIGGAESLWTTHTVRRADTTGFAAPRWYQVNVTGGTVAANLPQAATWDPDGANLMHRFIPSLAVDRLGDLALGYSTSSSTTKPAIKYAGRLASDPANTFSQTEQTLIQGAGTQTGNCGGAPCARWGDYAAMSLAPDGCTFWFTSMYYAADGLNHQTRIGSFTLPGCTQLAATGGTLQGTVTAAAGGAPLNGASIALGSRTTTTNSSGFYQFVNIPLGTYTSLTVSQSGYVAGSASNIVVSDGATTTQNFALNAAATNGCLTDTEQFDFQMGAQTNVDLTASPGNVVLAKPSLDQQNLTLGTSGVGITITTYGGQTFTPAVTGPLTKVDVNMFCSGCTGTTPNLTLSVRATSANLPTGADLATAAITGFSSAASNYYTGTFASPPTLTAGVKYALVIRPTANPSIGTYALLRSGTSTAGADVYAGGTRVSGATSGTAWSIPLTNGVSTDAGFRTYMNGGYLLSGNLVSGTKDANPPAGFTPNWGTFSWTALTPVGTGLQFQVAASNNVSGPFAFVGPDGTAATFFTTSGASLSQFSGLRYLQYKAYLSTTNSAVTPVLNDVTICYTNLSPATATVSGNATICAGASTNVTVNVSGGTAPYTVKLSNGAMQTGNGPIFTFPASPAVLTVYTLAAGSVDANSASITGSGSATVNVNQTPARPTITPGGPTAFCAGGSVMLSSSSATGNQWYLNGSPINGATNQTYSATAASSYTVIVTTNGCSSAPSVATTVANNTPPVLTYAAQSSATYGTALTINPATGPSDNGTINSIVVQSVTPAPVAGTLTVNNTTGVVSVPNNVAPGSYTVTIRATDNCGGANGVTDATFTLTVNCLTTAITTQPQSRSVTTGMNASFTVAASGTNLSYQWRKNSSPLSNSATISGATAATLVLNGVTAASAGSYDVIITNGCGSALTSSAAALTVTTAAAPLLVNELRFSGPNGAGDWYVEIYNNTDNAISTSGLKLNWINAAGNQTGSIALTPNLTIQKRGYYLVTGSTYSLVNVAPNDSATLPNGTALAGVLLCDATNAVLDAVGTTDLNASSQTQFGEGTLLTSLGVVMVEHAWVRKALAGSGLPQDTQNNANDFVLVATTSASLNGVTPTPGAPGPQNSSSPVVNNTGLPVTLLNPAVYANNGPNSVVESVPVTVGGATYTRSLYLRRTVTNNTGSAVRTLRFRITELSNGGVNTAILRALDSADITLTINGLPVAVKGLTLEAPTQPTGGGLNSTLSAGSITLGTPLTNGAKVNVQFRLGVAQGGSYRFSANVEAVN